MALQRGRLSLLCLGVLLSAANTQAQRRITFSYSAAQAGIIQADGPRQGASAETFFNVEGSGTGRYASYGVLRFDLSELRNELEEKFGAGRYTVHGIKLELMQSNARLTKDGDVILYYSADDTTDITNKTSPLKHPYSPTGSKLRGEEIGRTKFTKNVPRDKQGTPHEALKGFGSGKIDSFDLLQGAGGPKLLAHLKAGKMLTLVIREADQNVAATWAGRKPREGFRAPTLIVDASANR